MDWSVDIVPTAGKQLLFMLHHGRIYTRMLPLSGGRKVSARAIVLLLVKCHSFRRRLAATGTFPKGGRGSVNRQTGEPRLLLFLFSVFRWMELRQAIGG